jgi:t-SNARE complex subunit (syntaxin)
MQFVKDSPPPAVVFSPDAQPAKKKKDKKLSPEEQERKAEIDELGKRVHNMHLAADQERKDLATEDEVLPAVETGVKKATEDAKKVTTDTNSALKHAKK